MTLPAHETPAPTIIPAYFGDVPETHGLYVRVVNVTPKRAKAWLGNNGHHRKVKKATVARYAERIEQGAWLLNGKTIVLDRNGRLIGGQHRLHACVKSGKPFQTLVVWGVDPAVLTQESEQE